LLQPGDLVNIVVGSSASNALPTISSEPTVPVMMPREGLPVERNASNQLGRTIAQD
jgi:hypothetical protein